MSGPVKRKAAREQITGEVGRKRMETNPGCGPGSDPYFYMAPSYDAFTGLFLRAARKRIKAEAKRWHCRRVLDVACGTGELAIMLAAEGFDVVGVDLSPAMLGIARGKSISGVSFCLANAEALPFGPETFDCVTISLALHEMKHRESIEAAGEMLRVLAPGGKLMIFDYAGRGNRTFLSAFALGIFGLLEKVAGAEHFRNFTRFARMGGVDRFFEPFPLKMIKGRTYFMGALRLLVFEKTP